MADCLVALDVSAQKSHQMLRVRSTAGKELPLAVGLLAEQVEHERPTVDFDPPTVKDAKRRRRSVLLDHAVLKVVVEKVQAGEIVVDVEQVGVPEVEDADQAERIGVAPKSQVAAVEIPVTEDQVLGDGSSSV